MFVCPLFFFQNANIFNGAIYLVLFYLIGTICTCKYNIIIAVDNTLIYFIPVNYIVCYYCKYIGNRRKSL